MWGVIFWVLVMLLFLVEATPTWLLVILAGFSAFAVSQISGLFAQLPLNKLAALPSAMWAGDPWAWACAVLLAYVGGLFYFYRRLWIVCEVRLEQHRRGKR